MCEGQQDRGKLSIEEGCDAEEKLAPDLTIGQLSARFRGACRAPPGNLAASRIPCRLHRHVRAPSCPALTEEPRPIVRRFPPRVLGRS
jgi:hypothetical protein